MLIIFMMISIAIPTYNTSIYLKKLLDSLKECAIIDEIVICDDHSNINEVENIKNIINKHELKNIIKFIESKDNVGAFHNKYKVIKNCKNEIVYQIDSDNIAQKRLSKTLNSIIENFDKNYFYLPSKIFHFYESTFLIRFLSLFSRRKIELFSKKSLIVDSLMIKKSLTEKYSFIHDKNKSVFWVLNIGNFIVHKESFLKIMEEGLHFDRNLLSMDAVVITYLWLKSKKNLRLVNRFYHFHRKRNDSVSWIEKEDSKLSREYFTKKLSEL